MTLALPARKLMGLIIVLCFAFTTTKADNQPIPTGSFIINMGVSPQTYANGIKPWGMVFELIHDYKVQVRWIISQTKLKDGKDFTYNGVDYKGGTLIIPKKYRSAAVDARIAWWQTQGVVGVTTTADISLDVTYNLKYTPRWTFDFQNGSIAQNYLTQAGISTTDYPKKYPDQLNGCDDLFVMPHAEPTWLTHKNLLYWNKNHRGWLWYGCHAGSVVENLYNPADTMEKMNFLSNAGLVPDNSHTDGNPPYQYLNPNDPQMQFMGIVDGACQNGAEQVYLPKGNTGWRATSKASVHNPTQANIGTLSTGPAGIIVYGRGFGETNRGMVMMQAGHNFDKGTADAVAEIRAFFNFSFLSIADKDPQPTIYGPTNVTAGIPYTFTVSLQAGFDPANYTFHWTSPCGGKFSNPYGLQTQFTPPSSASCMPCEIMVTVTDFCGREYYETIELNGICPIPPVALDRICAIINNPPGTGAQSIVNQVPLAGTDEDGYVVNYVIKSIPANGVLSYDNDNNPITADAVISSIPGSGLVLTGLQMKTMKFDPNDGFGGNATFLYTVTDNAALIDLTPATYTIPVNPPPVAQTLVCNPVGSNAGISTVCPMVATDDGTIISYIITSLPDPAQCIVYLNNVEVAVDQSLTPAEASQLKFKPSGTFVGYAEITFTARDDDGSIDPTPATLTLQMVNQPPVADDITSSVIGNPVGNVMVAIPDLTGTDVDGTITSYMVTVAPVAAQGKLYYNNGGVYTQVGDSLNLTNAQAQSLKFDPKDDFSGIATFKFTVFDNAGLVDTTAATYGVPVQQTPPISNNISNADVYSGAGSTNIHDLTGSDPDATNVIAAFIIKSLPDVSQGVLQYNTGSGNIAITLGMELTTAQAHAMKFAPVSGYVGDVTFKYTVRDDEGLTDPSWATFTIPVVNKLPEARNVTANNQQDTWGKTTIKALDGNDQDGTVASHSIISLPDAASGMLYLNNIPVVRGQVIPAAQGNILQFDPALHFDGNAIFYYSSTDNLGGVGNKSGKYTIPVTGTGSAPVANDITTTAVNTSNTLQAILALTGSDADGSVVTFKIKSIPPANRGILYFQGIPATVNQVIPFGLANLLTFAPTGSYKGSATFNFTATDDLGNESAQATVTIPITNILPVANDYTIADIKKAATVKITGMTASDLDGTVASITVTKLPVLCTLQYDQAGAGTYINVALNTVMTPAQAARIRIITGAVIGLDTFCFKAKDNLNDFGNIANYIIPVAAATINQRPFANNIISANMAFNAPLTAISPLTGIDNDGTITSYVIQGIPPAYFGKLYYNVSGTTYDSIAIGGFPLTIAQAATLKFKPSGIYFGNVSIQYAVVDDDNAISSANGKITFQLTNADPVAIDISNAAISGSNGPALLTALSATDDGTIDSYNITSLPDPSQGILIMDGSPLTIGQTIQPMRANRIEFDPNPSFSGTASFLYSVTDNIGAIDETPATVTIPVTNQFPTSDDKISQVITNVNGLGAQNLPALTGNDYDGTITKFIIKTLPANGKLYKNGTEITSIPVGGYLMNPADALLLSFDPNDGFSGTTNFTYTVRDNSSQDDATPATFQIISNLPPVTYNIKTALMYANGPKTAIPALQGTDDGTISFWTITGLPSPVDGSLYLNNVLVTNLSQVDTLSALQITQLSFQPSINFDGVVFSYTATDNMGVIDVTPAIYEIPYGVVNTLPIKDITFTGSKSGADNILKWTTSQEIGLARFEVEYSADGVTFVKIGSVSATGSGSRGADYSLTDRNWVNSISFYRLKLVDVDGRFTYTNVVTIKRDGNGIVIKSVVPNPFTDKVTVEIVLTESKPVSLNLYDMSGKIVRSSTATGVKGLNSISLDQLAKVSSGMYILEVKNAEVKMTTKLVKAN